MGALFLKVGTTHSKHKITVIQICILEILFHDKALSWESIILLLTAPHLQNIPYYKTIQRPLRNTRVFNPAQIPD